MGLKASGSARYRTSDTRRSVLPDRGSRPARTAVTSRLLPLARGDITGPVSIDAGDSFDLTIASTTPLIEMRDTNAAADQQRFALVASGGQT